MVERFFGYGELPLVLLAMLDERELHGYELMSELDSLFAPEYSASPGSVYPALRALKAESLLEAVDGETPQRYRLTVAGREALTARLDKLAQLEHRTGVRVLPESLDAELGRLAAVVRLASHRVDREAIVAVLARATKRVQTLLEEGR